jgi:hypothetical protein
MLTDMFGGDSDEEVDRRSRVTAAVVAARAVQQNNSAPFAIVGQVSVGGGRGIIAMQDLPAGTLIVAEIPVLSFEDSSQLDDPAYLLTTLEKVCASPLAVDACAFIYPQRYEEADLEEQSNVAAIWGEERLEELSTRVGVARNELVRRVLTLQHNAFDTGLYKWLSMINHSCAPNCMKFAPSNSSSWASEIWTTRAVRAGEELTMSYRAPLETCSSSMEAFLLQNHRFSCTCAACTERKAIAALASHSSSAEAASAVILEEAIVAEKKHAEAFAATVVAYEAELVEVQDAIAAIESEQKWLSVDEPGDVLRTCKRMQRACDKLLERTLSCAFRYNAVFLGADAKDAAHAAAAKAGSIMRTLTKDVRMYTYRSGAGDAGCDPAIFDAGRNRSALLMLARIHKSYANAAALVLDPATMGDGSMQAKRKRVKQSFVARSLLCFVMNTSRLAELQERYFGPEHPDLAGTHLDVAEGLRAALDLYAHGPLVPTSTSTSKNKAASASAPMVAAASESTAEDDGESGDLHSLEEFYAALTAAEVRFLNDSLATSASTAASTPLSRAGASACSAAMSASLRAHRSRGETLKNLYATRKRFPEAYTVLSKKGDVYWGRPC